MYKRQLCGRRDDGTHFGRCGNRELGKERLRIIGNMKTGMGKDGVNPFLVTWFIKVLGGETPEWEEISPLGLNQTVKRAYEDQASIGWEHLLRGRVSENMVNMQAEWNRKFGEKKYEKRDARAVTVKALALGVLAVYEVWKVRCAEVAKIEQPTKIRVKMKVVDEIKGDKDMVEARDRLLFEKENLPKQGDILQKIGDWIESVQKAKVRALKEITSGTRIGR